MAGLPRKISAAEDLVDGPLHGFPHDGGRYGCRDDVEGELLGGGIQSVPAGTEEIADKLQDVAPEIERDCQEGADVEGYVEGEPRLGPLQELGDEYQVCGAADGEDLCQALDGSQYCGVYRIHADNSLSIKELAR